MLTTRGGLCNDRRFALFDGAGAIINGKREPAVHTIRVVYDAALTSATFTGPAGHAQRMALADSAVIGAWLGPVLGRAVHVRCDDAGGFPDDETAPRPTIISTATLAAVAAWFPGVDVESMRRRFRTNIEIGGVPAFWEDRLYAGAGEEVRFRIGAVAFAGTNPCQRCVVPTRDPDSGTPRDAFAKRLAQQRAATLPEWAQRDRFNHFYRLAVNTRVPPDQAGRAIRVGDAVSL
jgi:uncharacterized protein YcbX